MVGHLAAISIDIVEEIAAVAMMIVGIADTIVAMTGEEIVGMTGDTTAGLLQEDTTEETAAMIAGIEVLTVVMTVGMIDTEGKFVLL